MSLLTSLLELFMLQESFALRLRGAFRHVQPLATNSNHSSSQGPSQVSWNSSCPRNSSFCVCEILPDIPSQQRLIESISHRAILYLKSLLTRHFCASSAPDMFLQKYVSRFLRINIIKSLSQELSHTLMRSIYTRNTSTVSTSCSPSSLPQHSSWRPVLVRHINH